MLLEKTWVKFQLGMIMNGVFLYQQMRNLLERMSEAVSNGDPEEILEVGETMMILMQQHNVKEEGILYPMADQHLASYREELIERMDAVAIPA